MMRARRPLFAATILVGSFLLFLVQPMVARMALPRLGGAPNVWNSAMLVYQALLLGGYAYAHLLSRLGLRRQMAIHLSLLVLAALTLPITLARIPAAPPGWEPIWVPWLLLLTVGPVFFVVSAQAPLMQRWFAASAGEAGAGSPWALYAASNLGSFTGLIAYPLLAEPLLSIHAQSHGWSWGYGLLILLVAACAWSRWRGSPVAQSGHCEPALQAAPLTMPMPVPVRRKLHWLVLAAVPSGLMLSTTTHLTTDIFASPLLWVIPLGLYLLSFVVTFADGRGAERAVTWAAPVVVLFAGSYAMLSVGGTMMVAAGTCLLLFVVAVSLHSRLYDLRPDPSQLTGFYLVMSAGGALGGLFTALIAPLVFDWAWEHPLLVLAAACLMPLPEVLRWRCMEGVEPVMARIALVLLVAMSAFLSYQLNDYALRPETGTVAVLLTVFITGCGLMLLAWRWAFVAALAMAMVGQGGIWTIRASLHGDRTRSYFGIYTVRDYPDSNVRMLSHGTTLHGQQSLDSARRDDPLTYYGPTSGVSIAMQAVPAIAGPDARIGVIGLGTGSLACLARPGQHWTFFEIDPVVLRYSQDGTFTFLRDCAPHAAIRLGDARLELQHAAPGSFDVLTLDAFSSDAIPMHLLTREAFAIDLRALSPSGLLIVHISNRYIDLGPVISAEAKAAGLTGLSRLDMPKDMERYTPSRWLVLSRDPAAIRTLAQQAPSGTWSPLDRPAAQVWSDDHASILPFIRWDRMLDQ